MYYFSHNFFVFEHFCERSADLCIVYIDEECKHNDARKRLDAVERERRLFLYEQGNDRKDEQQRIEPRKGVVGYIEELDLRRRFEVIEDEPVKPRIRERRVRHEQQYRKADEDNE